MEHQPDSGLSEENETRLREVWARLTSGEQGAVRDFCGLVVSSDEVIEQIVHDAELGQRSLGMCNAAQGVEAGSGSCKYLQRVLCYAASEGAFVTRCCEP